MDVKPELFEKWIEQRTIQDANIQKLMDNQAKLSMELANIDNRLSILEKTGRRQKVISDRDELEAETGDGSSALYSYPGDKMQRLRELEKMHGKL